MMIIITVMIIIIIIIIAIIIMIIVIKSKKNAWGKKLCKYSSLTDRFLDSEDVDTLVILVNKVIFQFLGKSIYCDVVHS